MSRNVVEPLIEHLRSTGTGAAKLVVIAETAERCKSPQEFVEAIREQLPTSTMEKVEQWLAANLPGVRATAPVVKNNEAALAAEREALNRRRADLDAEAELLQGERQQLEADKAALAAEREAFEKSKQVTADKPSGEGEKSDAKGKKS